MIDDRDPEAGQVAGPRRKRQVAILTAERIADLEGPILPAVMVGLDGRLDPVAAALGDGVERRSVSTLDPLGREVDAEWLALDDGGLRVLDALDASSPSVGGPMDLCRITPEDGAQHLTPKQVEAVRKDVGRWVKLEQTALDGLFD